MAPLLEEGLLVFRCGAGFLVGDKVGKHQCKVLMQT